MAIHYAYWNEYLGFKFVISAETARQLPQWPSQEPFPPLPPRIAIERSREVVQALLREAHPFEPEFQACALHRSSEYEGGWWYYLVSWYVPNAEDNVADWSGFSVPVLFDGSTPEPLQFRYEDRFDIYRTRDT